MNPIESCIMYQAQDNGVKHENLREYRRNNSFVLQMIYLLIT